MQKVIQAKYGHLRAFNPVATLPILMTLLSEFCVLLLAVLLPLGIIILTVLLRLLAMLLRRDYLFVGLATATGRVTTPRDIGYLGIIFSTI